MQRQFALHPYSSVNLKRPHLKDILYDAIQLPWGDLQQYTLSHKIGRGRYSHVFEGFNLKTKQKIAIKLMLPISPVKIRRQYHIMKQLDHPKIVKVLDIVRCPQLRSASLILQLFAHQDFRELYPKLVLEDIRLYARQLFEGLDYLHSQGIMHRDIKPFNVLINPTSKQLKIIDFGLSEYYFPSKENNTKVASFYYKAPELSLGNSQYDYRIDTWAAGIILAGMIFKKTPFIVGNDPVQQIIKITHLLGVHEVVQYIKDYKLIDRKNRKKDSICSDIIFAFQNGDIKPTAASTFTQFVNSDNQNTATQSAIDLVRHLLVLDYKKRYTAKQALEHPFIKGL